MPTIWNEKPLRQDEPTFVFVHYPMTILQANERTAAAERRAGGLEHAFQRDVQSVADPASTYSR